MPGKDFMRSKVKMLVVLLPIAVLQAYLMCPSCNSFLSYFRVIAFTFMMWVVLWEGNNALAHFLDRLISWIEAPVKRFGVGLLSTIAYTFLSVYLLIWIFRTIFNLDFGNSIQLTVLTTIAITVVITLFVHSRTFLFHWRASVLEAEKFQRESVASKYESLKNKVNPQLLFTSLQTLGALVHTDKENAVKFIKQLSEVYRYILDSRDKDVVNSQREIRFLKSFFFLLEARFGEGVKLKLTDAGSDFLIAPLSVQIIIETLIDNATFDQRTPVQIDVSFASGIAIDARDVCWRDVESKSRMNDVAKNITDRYAILSNAPVKYDITDNSAYYKIPHISSDVLADVAETDGQTVRYERN